MASEYRFTFADKYKVRAELTQPMRTGGGESPEAVLTHPVTGEPFLQAYGIAGACREYAGKAFPSLEEELFGSAVSRKDIRFGRLRFSDGHFCGPDRLKMELRPHVAVDAETGTVLSGQIKGTSRTGGHKFNLTSLGAGNVLEFTIYLLSGPEDHEIGTVFMLDMFAAMHRGDIRFGGRKSLGCGRVRIASLLHKCFDMRAAEDRSLWAGERTLPDREYTEKAAEVQKVLRIPAETADAYEITVTGHTDSLLIKSIAVSGVGADAPDAAGIQNAAGEYIIPGSSLKGALRSRMEKIAGWLAEQSGSSCGDLLEELFGRKGTAGDTGRAGHIIVEDTVVGSRKDNDAAPLQHRIHIDKFTGGVINGSLFAERTVRGDLELRITVLPCSHSTAACGLLLLALRDLAAGQFTMGSGYGIGRGLIEVKEIRLRKAGTDRSAVICLESEGAELAERLKNARTEDKTGMITECLRALKEVTA